MTIAARCKDSPVLHRLDSFAVPIACGAGRWSMAFGVSGEPLDQEYVLGHEWNLSPVLDSVTSVRWCPACWIGA